jgi:predicted transposase YbfD/YdcC
MAWVRAIKTDIDREIIAIDGKTMVDVELFATAVRAHWGIENSLHYVLDVAFREDACRIKQFAWSDEYLERQLFHSVFASEASGA